MSIWSDGAPDFNPARQNGTFDRPLDVLPQTRQEPIKEEPKTSLPARAEKKVSRIRQFEGPRGYSTRAAVYLRYVGYFLAVLACSSLTEFFTEGAPNVSGGGRWLFMATVAIFAVGAGASLFFTNLREEIIDLVRKYVFHLMLPAGTFTALVMYAAVDFLDGGDAFTGTLSLALPMVFLCSVVIPAIIFVKEIFGMRNLYQSKLDDEEAVALWTRQDGYQR